MFQIWVKSVSYTHLFFRKKSQKLPALIQGFGDASVLGFGLADKFTLKGFTKYQIAFIQRGKPVSYTHLGLLFEGKIKVSQAALNGESRDENKAAVTNMDEAESTRCV